MAVTALTDLDNIKLFMHITGPEWDALLPELINLVSGEIERWCGRTFGLTEYKERIWSEGGKLLYLPQYPVKELRRIALGSTQIASLINTATDTKSATVQVDMVNEKIYLNVPSGATFQHDDFSLAGNTMVMLKALIEAGPTLWTLDITPGYEMYQARELLAFAACNALSPHAAELEIPSDEMEDLEVNYELGRVEAKSGTFPTGRYIFAEFLAGYETIPEGLELLAKKVVAMVARQTKHDPTLKSEKLGDYSWTAADASKINSMLAMFEDELTLWRRIAL